MSSKTKTSRHLVLFLLVTAVIAWGIRFAAAQGELWLDEVWSLTMVHRLASPWEIFTHLRIDNNHHLNSLWIYFVPSNAPLIWNRLGAVLSGMFAVVVAAALSAPRGRGSMIGSAICCSISYIMVHYSSEARGYAPLMLFLLLACWARERARASGQVRWSVIYAISCCLGFLSHLAFLQFFASAAALDLIAFIRKKVSKKGEGQELVSSLFRIALPSLFFALFWVVSLRGMQIGGGNQADYLEVILETLAISIGISPSPTGTLIGALIAFVMILGVIAHLWRIGPDWAFLFIGSAVVMPGLLLILMGREDIYPRYFLIGIVFFQWALGDWLGSLCFEGTQKQFRVAGGALLILFGITNLLQDSQLIRLGRSHYLEMLADAAEGSTSQPAYMTADHPFRQGMMLGFYLPRSSVGDKVKMATQPDQVPEWILVHGQNPLLDSQTSIDHPQLGHFTLLRKYPAVRLSGWDLYLYHKDSR